MFVRHQVLTRTFGCGYLMSNLVFLWEQGTFISYSCIMLTWFVFEAMSSHVLHHRSGYWHYCLVVCMGP